MCKKILIKYYIIFFFLNLFWSCDQQDGKLTLVNSSNDTIFYSLSCDDSITDYPINQNNGKVDINVSALIQPLDIHNCVSMDSWEIVINNCKDSTLKIFFFSKDLLKTASKDSIMNHQIYTKKEKLKVKDLEKLNWKVIYDVK